MAYYAALAPLVQLLDDIILHHRWPNFLLGREQVVKSVHEKFSFLEELLQDYSSKGDQVNDRVEGRIRDVAYRAQDIIESEISNQIRSETRTCATQDISHHQSISQEVDAVVQDLEMMQQEVDEVVQEMMVIKETQRIQGLKLNDDSLDYIGAFEKRRIGKNIMVGFDDYLNAIKDQLYGQPSHLEIISIVGMGGIGKTTLARNIFEDALILNHFDCLAWVTISQDYHIVTVLQSIRKSLGLSIDESHEKGEEEERVSKEERALKETIYKHLKGRRYLIVMDDVWSTQVLDDVKHTFLDDCNGSRIMVTTRLLDVAQYATNLDFLHELRILNEDESWNLLQEKVFAEKGCPLELMAIGKTIAKKCHGLPLAIVTMAGILSKVKKLHDWEKIATDVSQVLSKTDEHLSSILSLSYNHLPHQLKTCFLYMGVFPENYEIKISQLIKLWIAEGFVKSTKESKNVEKMGEECVVDLVKRNLVIITKTRSNGRFKFCILHDLLRDFCRERAFYECLFHVSHTEGYLYPKEVEIVCRISLNFSHLSHGNLLTTSKLVRSILCFGNQHFLSWFDVSGHGFESTILQQFELSRVLHFDPSYLLYPEQFSLILDAVSQNLHLKYLNLDHASHIRGSGPLYICLPPSISMLQNLQTLHIYSSHSSIQLPPDIWKMTQLKHLIINDMYLPPIPTSGDILVQPLGRLQTLMIVEDFIFTSEAIKMIPNLSKLKIKPQGGYPRYTWRLRCLYNLAHLTQLEQLKISFEAIRFGTIAIPYSFAFPPNLRELSLERCAVPWEGLTVVGSLLNLEVLKLRFYSFVGQEWEPKEGEFQRLKFLLLDDLNLMYWPAKDTHFPRLEHLRINQCNCLEEIPLEIGDIPTLKFIEVLSSSSGAEDSALLIQEEQQNLGNDVLQVHVQKHRFINTDGSIYSEDSEILSQEEEEEEDDP